MVGLGARVAGGLHQDMPHLSRGTPVRGAATYPVAAPQVLVPIGTGSEEMEAVITIDVLRRAGAEVGRPHQRGGAAARGALGHPLLNRSIAWASS